MTLLQQYPFPATHTASLAPCRLWRIIQPSKVTADNVSQDLLERARSEETYGK